MKALITALVLFASPAYAATIHVPAGGSLADAITAAKCGDTIALQPGGTFETPPGFTLTAKGCASEAQRITIKTAGVFVSSRNQCVNTYGGITLAKVQATANGAQTFRTVANADYWTIEGLEITALGTNGYGMVRIGDDAETVADNLPVGVALIGNYIHAINEQRRGAAPNAGAFALKWNCIKDFRETGADSQAIGAWNATGPCLIEDNYLQASSEPVLFGGSDPAVKGLVTSDCVITRNTIEQNPETCRKGFNNKNILELKNARRFLIKGNHLRYSCADAQDGWGVLFTTQNQGGACDWCIVADVQFVGNTIRDVSSCFSISARDAEGQPSGVMTNILIEDNLCVTNVAVMGPGGHCFGIGSSPMGSVVIRRNTFINEGTCVQLSDRRGDIKSTGVIYENNLARHGSYGIVGIAGVGTPTLNYFWAPGYVFSGNVLADGLAAGYDLSYYPAPAVGTTMPTQAQFESGFAGYVWPFTVKPDGIFAGKGAQLALTVPLPPAVDPCVQRPLVVKVTAWPKGNSGKRSGTWDSFGVTLRSHEFKWNPQRFEAIRESDGCSATVYR
jgi:hypothetical protein